MEYIAPRLRRVEARSINRSTGPFRDIYGYVYFVPALIFLYGGTPRKGFTISHHVYRYALNQRGDGDDNGERRGPGPWARASTATGPGALGPGPRRRRVHWDPGSRASTATGPLGPWVPGPRSWALVPGPSGDGDDMDIYGIGPKLFL